MDQQAKVIDFINRLPSDVNPYFATANMLEAMVHSPRSPPWSRRLRIAVLVLTEIMLFQGMYLLYQRFRINKSPRVKCNNLGLVIVNISITSALAYISYAILTIYVLLVRIALDFRRRMDESMMLLVFGIKFFTVILGSWAFFWVCACQSAKVFWNSDLASKMNRDVLRNLIKWGVSGVFVCASIGPLIPITLEYGAAYRNMKAIESIAHGVASTLRAKGETYDPENFSKLGLLTLLIPAKKLPALLGSLESNIRLGQQLYLGDLTLLSLVYLPLLIISLKALYRQSLSQVTIDAALGSGQQSKDSPISNNIRRQRQRLVYHAFCVYFATSIHLPMVLYQIIVSRSPGFMKTAIWQEMTFQGLHVPLAISGNIILSILNLHAYIVLQDNNKSPTRSASCTRVDQTSQTLFQKLSSFGLGFVMTRSEEDTIELDDLEAHQKDHSVEEKDPKVSTEYQKHLVAPNAGIRITQLTVSMSS